MEKKKIFIIVVELMIIVFLLTCYFVIFSPDLRAKVGTVLQQRRMHGSIVQSGSMPKQAKAATETLPLIEADIEVAEQTVTIKEDITLKEAENTIHAYIPSNNIATTNIRKVSSDSEVKDMVADGMNLTVQLLGVQNKLHIEYEIYLNANAQSLAYSENYILLTNFLITPAVMKNDQPVLVYTKPYGDPYIYDTQKYQITVKTNSDYGVYAPGKIGENAAGDQKITTFSAENMRDFPIAIVKNKNVAVTTERVGDTDIYFINSDKTQESVVDAFIFGIQKIGPYPYKDFFVVKAPISQRGMEFSNMIFISDQCFNDRNALKGVTYHEVFHQWFYGIIGTDQVDEPFLDEGMVNHLATVLSGVKTGTTFSESLFNMTLNDYQSKQQYYELAYNHATAYFNWLHQKLGDQFYVLLRKVYNEKKFSTLYFDEFLKYSNEFLGGN